jgi:hypothetical protein
VIFKGGFAQKNPAISIGKAIQQVGKQKGKNLVD